MKKNIVIYLFLFSCVFLGGSAKALQIAPDENNTNVNVSVNTNINEEAVAEQEQSMVIENINTEVVNLTEYTKTYYASGDNLEINGHFLNDVMIAGNNVVISGIVEGDVLAAGNNVTIKAQVNGNIRAAGATITLEGSVKKNVSFAAGQVNTTATSLIEKDLQIFSGSCDLQGNIGGDLKLNVNTAVINGIVNGNADLNDSVQIEMGEQGLVMGDLTYKEGLTQPIEQSKVKGKINLIPAQAEDDVKESSFAKYGKISFWLWNIIKLLGLIIVSFVVIYLFKETTTKTIAKMHTGFNKNIFWGFLFIFLGPAVCIISILTVIGLPLGILSLVVYFILQYTAAVFVGLAIGKKIFPKDEKPTRAIFLGILIFYVLKLIPFIGWLVVLILNMWAIGALLTRNKLIKKEEKLETKDTKKIILKKKKK